MATSQKFDILDGLETSGNVAFDTNVLFVDAVNDRVGVKTITPTTALDVNGTATINNLTLDNLAAQGSEATSLMINDSGVVGTRELGTLAFSSATLDNYNSWTIQDGDSTTYSVTSGDTLQITGPADGIINANFTADDVLTIDHGSVTRSDTATTLNPTYGDDITAVTSITTNSDGHVTAINVETVTLPASDNTDSLMNIAAASSGTVYPAMVTGTGAQSGVIDTSGFYFQPATNLLYVANTVQSGVRVKTPKVESSLETDTHITFPAADRITFTTGNTEKLRITNLGAYGECVQANGHILSDGYIERLTDINTEYTVTSAGVNISGIGLSATQKITIPNSPSTTYTITYFDVPTTDSWQITIKVTAGTTPPTNLDFVFDAGLPGFPSSNVLALRWAEGVRPPESTGSGDIDIYTFYMIDGIVYGSLAIRNAG